jgi:hypothetical protein
VFVRTDIPLADQIVQVGHACFSAGLKCQISDEEVNLVLLSMDSEKQLLASLGALNAAGIKYVVFHEPDDEMGYTAACTEPLTGTYRREFHNYQLWRPSGEVNVTDSL